MDSVEKRLSALEVVKEKVEGIDRDVKKLWTVLEERDRKLNGRLHALEEKVETYEFDSGRLCSKVDVLEQQKEELRDEVTYLQSQSMRNNLIFDNIPEDAHETHEQTEKIIRDFIKDKLKLAQSIVDEMDFERVHRMGYKQGSRIRKIVAKFHRFKDREIVRRQCRHLKGTNFFVSEQYPKEVADTRRKLVPQMKQAREDGKQAWIIYDTLYIDGKAVHK